MGYKSKYTGAQVEEMLDNMLNPREVIHDAGFDNCHIAIADGFIEQFNGVTYVVPESRAFIDGNYDEVLATQSYVDEHIPTEVATAMQKVQLTSAPSLNSYTANRVYEWNGSVKTLTISTLYAPNSSYDNVWVIRFGCEAGIVLNITPSVYWKDGVAPSFGTWGICELTFKKNSSLGVFLGEWKIYK